MKTNDNHPKKNSYKVDKFPTWLRKNSNKTDIKKEDLNFTILTESDLKANRSEGYSYILP